MIALDYQPFSIVSLDDQPWLHSFIDSLWSPKSVLLG